MIDTGQETTVSKDQMDKDHKTEKVVIKEAEVDVAVRPVVDWINSFAGLMTKYSCEGDDNGYPYVSFISSDEDALYVCIKMFCEYNGEKSEDDNFYQMVEVGANGGSFGRLTYTLRFHSTEDLKGFIEFVGI